MKNYRFFVSYVKKKKIVSLILLMILASFFSLCPPYIISYLLDNGVVKFSTKTVICCGLCLICVYICSFSTGYLINQSLTKTSNYFIANLKNDLFTQVLKLPMEFFDQKQTGYIMERIKEVDSLNVFFSPVFLKFLTSVFSFLGALVIIFSIRWELLIIILFFLPIIYVFTTYSGMRIKKASRILLESAAETTGKVQENIGGISAVKELNMEKQRATEISLQLKRVADNSVKRGKIMNVASEGIQGIINLGSVILVVCSGLFIIKGKMSLGDYWAVSQYALIVFAPMQLFASISIMVQPGIVAISRIGEILRLKTENEIGGNQRLSDIKSIVFSNVSFGYTEQLTIRNFNLVIHNTEKVVLFGKNGSGKTTLAKLLMGFYKTYHGSIRINNIELKEISLSDLRSKIGIVAQNIVLFSGTLLDNIRYIAPNLTEEDVMKILEKAGVDVSEFTEGLNTTINENGKNLSGGQRQKIAFARMIVKNPDVVIFDEATSNLDTASKYLVEDSIRTLFSDKICIIITHDQDVAAVADTIVRL